MEQAVLELPETIYSALRDHLLPDLPRSEQAAFVFATVEKNEKAVFRFVEWMPVTPEGFTHGSAYYFELTDEMRGRVIKRAHDLGASLIEFHSHLASLPARFSATDISGLKEFVPHVWWRLKGRPYMAVVVAPTSFDAVSWTTNPNVPEGVAGILAGSRLYQPTGLTLMAWDHIHGA